MLINVTERSNGFDKVQLVKDDRQILISYWIYQSPVNNIGVWDELIDPKRYDCSKGFFPLEIYQQIEYKILWEYLLNKNYSKAFLLVSKSIHLIKLLHRDMYQNLNGDLKEKRMRVVNTLKLLYTIDDDYWTLPHNHIFPNTIMKFNKPFGLIPRPWNLTFDRLEEINDEEDGTYVITLGSRWGDVVVMNNVDSRGYFGGYNNQFPLNTTQYECESLMFPIVQLEIARTLNHQEREYFDMFENFMKKIYGKYATLIVFQ